jgi:hypothetical protein
MANDKLVNLLYYTDKDPLSQKYLTQEEKKELIFEKLIKIVPRIGPKEDAKSIIVIKAVRANKLSSNTEFKDVKIQVEIVVPLTQWFIKDSNLRPYLIMGEIEESLNGKTVNGLGKMIGGDFDTNFFTEEVSAFEQTFWITSYE